jgi:hypothetical protein
MHRDVVRHWPFQSPYLRDIEVLEEWQPGRRLFPMPAQGHSNLNTLFPTTNGCGSMFVTP